MEKNITRRKSRLHIHLSLYRHDTHRPCSAYVPRYSAKACASLPSSSQRFKSLCSSLTPEKCVVSVWYERDVRQYSGGDERSSIRENGRAAILSSTMSLDFPASCVKQ